MTSVNALLGAAACCVPELYLLYGSKTFHSFLFLISLGSNGVHVRSTLRTNISTLIKNGLVYFFVWYNLIFLGYTISGTTLFTF